MSRLGAQLPFDQARQNLETDYGVHVSKHLLEQVCERAGCKVLECEDAQRERLQQLPREELFPELPESPFSPEKAYVFADGAMLHRHPIHRPHIGARIPNLVRDWPL